MSPADASQCGLAGRLIVVTGGTRGIGGAITRQLARAGARVIAVYARHDAAAAALASSLEGEGAAIELCRADLSRPAGLDAVIAAVGERALAGLVHAAATGIHGPLEKLGGRQWDFTYAVNVRAFLELAQRLLPRFASGASIVAVSSEGAERAVPHYALVGSSKAALESLCRHMAVELGARGVRVNVLSPGAVKTEAWDVLPDAEARLSAERARHPQGRLTTVEEVAAAAQFLCADASAGISGHTLVVDGGARIRQ